MFQRINPIILQISLLVSAPVCPHYLQRKLYTTHPPPTPPVDVPLDSHSHSLNIPLRLTTGTTAHSLVAYVNKFHQASRETTAPGLDFDLPCDTLPFDQRRSIEEDCSCRASNDGLQGDCG
ncbi:hypothetical protein VTN96DRAFT_6679 [Rasamsonia emersonii]